MKVLKKIIDLIFYIWLGVLKELTTPKDHLAIYWLRLKSYKNEVFVETYSSLNQISKLVIEYAVLKDQKHFYQYVFKNLLTLLSVTRIPAGKKVLVIKLPIRMFIKILWERDNEEHADIYEQLINLSRYAVVLIRPKLF